MRAPPTSPVGYVQTIWYQTFRDGLAALEAITALRAELDTMENHAALNARQHGCTWEEIASAIGVSRQRAHQRWGSITAWLNWDRPSAG